MFRKDSDGHLESITTSLRAYLSGRRCAEKPNSVERRVGLSANNLNDHVLGGPLGDIPDLNGGCGRLPRTDTLL